MGKKKVNIKKWMPYAAARLIVQQHKVRTRRGYAKWWEQTKPIGIPKYPYRVYLTDWITWNDFLGNKNMWIPKSKHPPFWTHNEALKWASKKGYKTAEEWNQACKRGEVPKTIPRMPDRYYKEWIGWPVFLGLKLEDKIQAAKINTSILAICVPEGLPGGYMLPLIAHDGEPDFKIKHEQIGSPKVIKLYQWDKNKTEWFKNILSKVGSPQENGLWLIRNLAFVISELDQELLWYVRR